MVSTHSRRRFRDIAALVDLAEEESEVTATTSLVQRTTPVAVNETNNRSNHTTTTTKSISFADQLKHQRQHIQHQEENDVYDESSSPHLSAFLLQQQEQTYSESLPYTNVALDGEETSNSSDSNSEVRSHAAAYSSADLSMEAEANSFWGGSTAQRFTTVRRIQEEPEESFRSSFHDRLRSRFSPQKPQRKTLPPIQQSPIKPPPKQSFDTESLRELVLNSTDSTDTCTVSSSSNRSSHMESHESSYELPLPIEEEESLSPIQPVDYEESVTSWNLPNPVEDETVPSWKMRQRLQMRELMVRMESEDEQDEIMTPPRSTLQSTPLENIVTPPSPPEHDAVESIESPPPLARTKSWRSKEFKRTFRHKAIKKQLNEDEDDGDDDDEVSVDDIVPTVSFDEGSSVNEEAENEDSEEQEETNTPDSPVKRLRHLFEAKEDEENSDDSTSKAYMDDPSLHEERRKNHKVVNYPKHSLTKAALEVAEDDAENDSVEETSDTTSDCQISKSEEPPALPPAVWWIEMGEKVDRYHRTVMTKSESEDVRKTFEDFAETQNQLGRAMAVALCRGMEVGRNELQERHEKELRELKEKHKQELEAARNNTTARTTPATANATNRNEAFRQRWKSRMSSNLNNRDPTEVASTVVSNMSCRELSVARYRTRILAQMNQGKKKSAPSVASLYNNDDRESDISTPTTASEAQNNQNAEEIQRLLDELQQAERRQKLLEKQLQQSGIVLAEDIPYQLAKDKVAAISKRMNEIGSSDVVHEDPLVQKQLREEYFRLEKDMQKYLSALMLTDEFAQEQRFEAEQWEAKHAEANKNALDAIRKHMPLDIRTISAQQLEEDRGLPKPMVQKFRRTNVLQLLRVDPTVVAKWHPSTVEAFRVTGMTLTERRAIHAYLLPVAEIWRGKSDTLTSSSDPMTSRKLAWFNTMKTNFAEALSKYERHLGGGTTGSPRRHVHSTCLQNRCNLVGNQCPVRANRAMDYFATDLGFPYREHERLYEDAKVVVGNKDLDTKSPAEIIAEARGQPRESHVFESPARTPKPKAKAPTPKTRPRHPLMDRPKHPMMSKGPAKPGGLLAAIAARRID